MIKIDQFYTKPTIAGQCIKKLGSLSKFDLIVEPSAGTGSFFDKIKHNNKVAYDLDPKHPMIKKKNWFSCKIPTHYKNVAVIGNPPFGIKNKLSSAFIQHALSFPNVHRIAFILPDVYNKHTRQAIIPVGWRIKTIWKLPDNSFIYNQNTFHVPCSFYVFCRSKGKDMRTPTELPQIKDFSFARNNDYDLFVFGASPKKIITKALPNNRGYFLKSHIAVSKLKERLANIEWKGNSCANGGVFWLTKYEFAEHYDRHYGHK